MDVLLAEARPATVEFWPPKRPASATCDFSDKDGALLESPTATVDPALATIGAVQDAEGVTVTVTAGDFVAGRWYWWVGQDGQESRVLLSRREGDFLRLDWPVSQPQALVGDTLRGARVTAALSATATAERGENHSLSWVVTNADSTVSVIRQIAHVVRAQVRPAMDVGACKAAVALWWPHLAEDLGAGFFHELAERASDRVWRRIRRTGRYLHLLWDANDFDAAGRVALQIELAQDGHLPGGILDRAAWLDSLEEQFNREIEDVVSSRPYDGDDSGTVDEETEIRSVRSMSLRRW